MRDDLPAELAIARLVQEKAHPERIPAVPGYTVYAHTVPATWGNGDLYETLGVRPRDGGTGYVLDTTGTVDHLVLALGDATGHGMGAALLATGLKAMLRATIRLGVHHRDMMAALNQQLLEDLPDGHFITLFLGRLDRGRNLVRWVSFGQAPVWHYRAADGSVQALDPHEPPLGLLDSLPDYRPTETPLDPGDALLVLSDGYPETRDACGRLIGDPPLMATFAATAREPPKQVFSAIWGQVERHAQGQVQADDRTFLLVRRNAD